MSKFKRVLKIILGILVISVFLVGIPIAINECYKANCGYSTAWDASAMLEALPSERQVGLRTPMFKRMMYAAREDYC